MPSEAINHIKIGLKFLFVNLFSKLSNPKADKTEKEKLKIIKILLSEEVDRTGIFVLINKSKIGLLKLKSKDTNAIKAKNTEQHRAFLTTARSILQVVSSRSTDTK